MDLESWEYIIEEEDTKENNGGDSTTRPRSHSVPDFSSFEIVSKHTVESALKQCVTDIHALEIMYNVNDEDEKRDVEAKEETKDETKDETRENNNRNVKNQIINSKRFENYPIENSEEVACCNIL